MYLTLLSIPEGSQKLLIVSKVYATIIDEYNNERYWSNLGFRNPSEAFDEIDIGMGSIRIEMIKANLELEYKEPYEDFDLKIERHVNLMYELLL